ncbi:hypothetical protein ACROYT_G012636 [Oculina patagonica]
MLVRLGKAVPFKDHHTEGDFNDGAMENVFDDMFREARDCTNKGSDAFCRRWRKYCSYSNQNGKFVRERCRFSCGCV